MATKGSQEALLLLGKAIKTSRIGVRQIPCVQVRCKENEFNAFLKMYFGKSTDFWAVDLSGEAALGDEVLIRPNEYDKRPATTVTHAVTKIISKYGQRIDPITKKPMYKFIQQFDYAEKSALQKEVGSAILDDDDGAEQENSQEPYLFAQRRAARQERLRKMLSK